MKGLINKVVQYTHKLLRDHIPIERNAISSYRDNYDPITEIFMRTEYKSFSWVYMLPYTCIRCVFEFLLFTRYENIGLQIHM